MRADRSPAACRALEAGGWTLEVEAAAPSNGPCHMDT
jgi:hypothetical protein